MRISPSPHFYYMCKGLFRNKTDKNLAAKHFVNFSMKKEIDDENVPKNDEAKLHKKYDGQNALRSLNLLYEDAKIFLDQANLNPNEKIGIERILKNRKNLYELLNTPIKNRAAEVVRRIRKLEKNHSKKVVQLENGTNSLTIPLHSRDNKEWHFSTFEIQLERHKGFKQYYLYIHDRALMGRRQGVQGSFVEESEKGCRYGQTTAKIKIYDPGLLDEKFFTILFKCVKMKSFEAPYIFLKYSLINSGKGKIVRDPQVEAFKVLIDNQFPYYHHNFQVYSQVTNKVSKLSKPNKATLQEIANELNGLKMLDEFPDFKATVDAFRTTLERADLKKIKEAHAAYCHAWKSNIEDPRNERLEEGINTLVNAGSLHSTQAFGTCSVSNITQSEKEMADPVTIRKLKLFGIERRIEAVANDFSISSKNKLAMMKVAEARKNKLLRDIKKMEHSAFLPKTLIATPNLN